MNTGACGTTAGYKRHKRAGSQACRPCLDAKAAYQRARRILPPRTNVPAGLLAEKLDELQREYGSINAVARAYTAQHGGREDTVARFIHRILTGQKIVWERTYEKWVVL